MRLMVCSQPSGVVRLQEMRDSRSLSSTLWQGEQVLRTSSLVMGIPESSSSFSFSVGSFGSLDAGAWATSDWTRTAIEIAQIKKGFMPISNIVSHAMTGKAARRRRAPFLPQASPAPQENLVTKPADMHGCTLRINPALERDARPCQPGAEDRRFQNDRARPADQAS